MLAAPGPRRTVAFVDGQNLFYSAKTAFGHAVPNYDPIALAEAVCRRQAWSLELVCFYTGVPPVEISPRWNQFWTEKLSRLGTRGAHTFMRPLRYTSKSIVLASGEVSVVRTAQEKGIDVRLALDVVRFSREDMLDVALIFSQDQDLSEVADEVRAISRAQARWIKIACAFPSSPFARNRRGIDKTDWIPIDRALYDSCLDPHDYRPRFES